MSLKLIVTKIVHFLEGILTLTWLNIFIIPELVENSNLSIFNWRDITKSLRTHLSSAVCVTKKKVL